MELENKDYIPVEKDCPNCHRKMEFIVPLNTPQGKFNVYICQNCGKEIRVPANQ